MTNSIPLSGLTHRLANAHVSVLDPPVILQEAMSLLSTAAVLSDLLLDMELTPLYQNEIEKIWGLVKQPNHLKIIQISCVCMHDQQILEHIRKLKKETWRSVILKFFLQECAELSAAVKAQHFLKDSEGREELCRRVLRLLELLPEGETETQAKDRLASIDTLERKKVIEKAKTAQKRAKEIREAIARQEAEEAASKMTRE